MKTYEEKANSVLSRIAEENEMRSNRRKSIVKITTPIMSFALVVLMGLGVWQSGIFKNGLPTNDAGNTGLDGNYYSTGNKGDGAEVSEQDPAAIVNTPHNQMGENQIYINTLREAPSLDRANICLLVDDFVKLNPTELCNYYGTNVFPVVPDDLKNWDTASDYSGYGIYRRDNGNGELYYDINILNYSNDDFSRNINIEVSKGSVPQIDFAFDTPEYKTSVILGENVLIGLTGNGYYFIEMVYNDTGFFVTANGLSEEEIVAVVQSLIK